MRILIYDVETANQQNLGSICAVAWMLLDNDQEVDSGYSLINPRCSFSQLNTDIHGITSADVSNSPCFGEYWESTLKNLMTTSLVVAHNAGFDLSATEQALYNVGVEDPGIDYFDSLAMFRNLFRAESYKLKDLAADIGYEYDPHNALADVKALYAVLVTVRKVFKYSDLADMMLRSNIASENTLGNNYIPHHIAQQNFTYNSSRCKEDVEIIDHAFAGLRFCFTGWISGYERADLERIIKQHDGKMTGAVSGKTNYLVVGSNDDYGPGYISGKQKAAAAIIENGGHIQIITPEEFFSMAGCDEQ